MVANQVEEKMVNGSEVEEEVKVIRATTDMEITHFSLEVSREELSVAQFMDRLRNFKFNDPIQRNLVWSIQKKSLLIVSILEEVSIGEIKAQILRINKMRIRNVLDGKQRLTTIRDFVRNRFALVNAMISSFDEEGNSILIDVSGMYFNELPKQYQDRITALILDIKGYENLDDKMKAELFQRWNNGESLRPSQLRKSMMSYDLLFAIAELKQNPIFEAGFSENARNNDTHSDMLLKALAILKTNNQTALDSKTINSFLREDAFDQILLDELKSIAQYLGEVLPMLDEKTTKKSFGAMKTIALIYVGKVALENGYSKEQFSSWMEQFFVKDYAKSGFGSRSGTAQIETVQKRHKKVMDHFTTFFNQQQ